MDASEPGNSPTVNVSPLLPVNERKSGRILSPIRKKEHWRRLRVYYNGFDNSVLLTPNHRIHPPWFQTDDWRSLHLCRLEHRPEPQGRRRKPATDMSKRWMTDSFQVFVIWHMTVAWHPSSAVLRSKQAASWKLQSWEARQMLLLTYLHFALKPPFDYFAHFVLFFQLNISSHLSYSAVTS